MERLTPEQIETKRGIGLIVPEGCRLVLSSEIESLFDTIEAQQQEIDILNMGIAELRESNQALKDYAENADADKDEQAGRIMRMDYLLRRTLPILEATNNQQELIQAINAMLGGKEDV